MNERYTISVVRGNDKINKFVVSETAIYDVERKEVIKRDKDITVYHQILRIVNYDALLLICE